MKKLLLSIVSLIFSLNIFAQFGTQQIISTFLSYPVTSYPVDIDGDNKLDILVATWDEILWYKNIDNQGNYGQKQVISDEITNGSMALGVDVDGDGDLDVISSSQWDNKIAWYENINGSGDFGPQQIITTIAYEVVSINASDVDGDNDIDIIGSSRSFDKITWYENTDGLGNFSSELIVTTDVTTTQSVITSDIDMDGDMDVVFGSWNKVAWQENVDGEGSFDIQHVIDDTLENAFKVSSNDLDGDGDFDILAISYSTEKIVWYENLDGLGTFSSQILISEESLSTLAIFASDLDSDGDLDVLSGSVGDDKIAWYENLDGLGTFGQQQLITSASNMEGVRDLHAYDLDIDGDMDILATFSGPGKIAWYENLLILNIEDNSIFQFSIHPIPVTNIINIQAQNNIVQIEVYNVLGQLVISNLNKNQINISTLSSDLYIIRVRDSQGNFGIKRVIKE